MGKRILVQRRGKGGIQFRAPSKGKLADARYPLLPPDKTVSAVVTDILHERGRSAPLAQLCLENGVYTYIPAVSGMKVGSKIEIGPDAEPRPGNVLPLSKIPEGTVISNIEKSYGDGGKLIRAAGSSAILYSHTSDGSFIKMPSGAKLMLSSSSRATIGVIAGGGRLEKPFLKAGTKYHLMKAKGKPYPRVRGVAMASVYHPFGGGRHQHPGKSTSTHRHAPPGRKVGHIAPRKTGRKKIAKKLEVR